MQERIHPELQCKNMDAAAQMMQLAIDDAAMVEQVLTQLAARLAEECRPDTEEGTRTEEADAADPHARHVVRIAALMIESAHALADVGDATRARFSRLLTERLASGRHELIDAYQAFFSVLPSQNQTALESMQLALARCDRALSDALGFATQPARAMPPAALLLPHATIRPASAASSP